MRVRVPLIPACLFAATVGLASFADAGTVTTLIGTYPGDVRTEPQAVNSSGMVAGWSDNAAGARRAFVWSGGVFTAIPSLGGTLSEARDVNDAGQVVGRSGAQGFLWSGSTLYDLGVVLGATSSEALRINEAGQVIGTFAVVGPARSNGFLFDTATWQAYGLGMPAGATNVIPLDVNDAGSVVGTVRFQDGTSRAFLWSQAGGLVLLPSLGGTYDSAVDVNNAGVIAGASNGTAVIWTGNGGTIVDVGAGLPVPNEARKINELGDIAVRSWADPNNAQLHFRPGSGGAAQNVGTLGGRYADCAALDEQGNMSGWSENSRKKYHAFYRVPGAKMIDLSAGSSLYSAARSMNDSGQVVGWTVDQGKKVTKYPAVLWTVTP
jgi:probable HAF family extracellular repeat protein